MKKIVLSLLVMCLTFVMIIPLDVKALSTRGPSDEYYYCSAPKYTTGHKYGYTESYSKYYDAGIKVISEAIAYKTDDPRKGSAFYTAATFYVKDKRWYQVKVKYYYQLVDMSCDIKTGTGDYVGTKTYKDLKVYNKKVYEYN